MTGRRRDIDLVDVSRSFIDMCCICIHIRGMGSTIEVPNVPEDLHLRLKSRAATAGMSLSDYLLREIHAVTERPTIDELRARLQSRTPCTLTVPPADAIRYERDRRLAGAAGPFAHIELIG